ncbi:MAG: tyrosine-type recombinase/integrase [Bacteroidota bacterium]
MEKKKFLPAKLIKGKDRWYILYYQTNPATGQLERFRETRHMNRIKDKRQRSKLATTYIKEINEKLPYGWPFHFAKDKDAIISIKEAINLAIKAKLNMTEKNTHRSYDSISKIFLEYCKKKKYLQIDIRDFTKKDAFAFLDHALIKRELSGRTYNNYIIRLKSLWNVMIERELLTQNPWVGIKKATEGEKKRTTFTDDQRRIAAKYIYEQDIYMFWAILLLYYCLLRPAELRRLKFKNFDVIKGTIDITADINLKSKKRRMVTIPPFALKIFRQKAFVENPINSWVFGEHLKPHYKKQCSPNAMNKRHKRYMKNLNESGELLDIEGLTLYSWKDTGITDHSKQVSLLNLQRQAGHAKPETTLIYYQPDEINHEIQAIQNNIFE